MTIPYLLEDIPHIKLDPAKRPVKVFNENDPNPALIFENNRSAIRKLVSKYEYIKNPRIYGSVANGTWESLIRNGKDEALMEARAI